MPMLGSFVSEEIGSNWERMQSVSGIPFLLNQGSEPSMRFRAQIVRVLDAGTSLPIENASVNINLLRRFDTDRIIHKRGHTNAQGIFVFTFEEANRWAEVFMSVNATGYWGMSDEFRLVDEKVITLFRPQTGGGEESGRAKVLRIDMECCGRLLSWPT
jgi:hypothetical protein